MAMGKRGSVNQHFWSFNGTVAYSRLRTFIVIVNTLYIDLLSLVNLL